MKPLSPPQSPSIFISLLFSIFLLSLSFANGDDASIMTELAKSLSPTPSGWSGSNPCKWSGIQCDSYNHVTSISLSSKLLSGQLPSNLNQLSHLKYLSLQRNRLSGPLPSFSNLINLQEIYLDDNNFSSIPRNCFIGLTSLQTLSIGNNQNLAPWTIPSELSDLTSLVSLIATNANIVGTMPDIFGSFPSLQSLRLSYNNLTGSLPLSFANSGIQNLWLNNQVMGLSGKIDVLGSMSQLVQVWIHVNDFSGPIPDLSNCSSLFDLQLRDNQITGIVPASLFSIPRLVNVSLQNNRLQGPYPEFGNGVQVTLGSANSFCKTKPGPCDPQVTTLLTVAGALGYPLTLAESWRGNDPCQDWTFVTCDSERKNVIVINFGKQHWTGKISPAFANLTSLRSLLLNDNRLIGPIPDSLTGLSQLQLLDVSNNNLTGGIPKFSSNVTLRTWGNPFLGTSSNGGSQVGVAFAIAVIVAICIGFVSWFIFKYCMKSSQTGNEELRNVMESEMSGTGNNDTSDFHIYGGGNVSIPMKILEEATNKFSRDNILGRGGFGIVYRGEFPDGTRIAVKKMETKGAGKNELDAFKAEIKVLTEVKHRHLVALHGYCIDEDDRLLVYEYMPQGTLGQHLFECGDKKFSPLTWKQRLTIALDVARGVEYLHNEAQKTYIHRDLKPSNILLGDGMRAKVSDFGLVKLAPDGTNSLETRLAGTFGYLAPEYAAFGKVTTKVDVYAFGVVLMELITGRKALDNSLSEDKISLVNWYRPILCKKDSIRSYLDSSLDPDDKTFESICVVAELAVSCTVSDQNERPDISHAVFVLSPLVKEWKPTSNDEKEKIGIVPADMTLREALQIWKSSEASSSTMTGDIFNRPSH